tara:strand:- start:331 stop:585 length:255 start_codon:yes stop_codon:yes gene_type:complete
MRLAVAQPVVTGFERFPPNTPVDVKMHTVRVVGLDASGGVVRLTIDEMRPGYVYELHATGIRNLSQGKPLLHSAAYYTLNRVPK